MSSNLKTETVQNIKESKPFLYTLVVMISTGFILQIIFYDVLGFRKEIIPCIFFFSMIPFLIMFNIYIKQKKVDFKDIGISKNKLKTNIAIGLIVGVFAGIVGLILFSVLGIPTEKITGEQAWQVFILLFLPICICAPIWEEIATRGLFFTFIEKSIVSNMKVAKQVKGLFIIVVVSLFFLLAHFEREPSKLFVIFCTSLIFTTAYYHRRNLIVPIIAHLLYNLFVMLNVLLL